MAQQDTTSNKEGRIDGCEGWDRQWQDAWDVVLTAMQCSKVAVLGARRDGKNRCGWTDPKFQSRVLTM